MANRPPPDVFCSFCELPRQKTRMMVIGRTASICLDCMTKGVELLARMDQFKKEAEHLYTKLVFLGAPEKKGEEN